ncbi:MAG: LacI family transcriptional regulator [Ponticaulis sp.]|nr:LacI family transcriptional regulator [Ponticaulis sp.]|tara:strand:+ start:14137 stop:15141 length:1005 start_codon:yes stop_codon:yes gene_type:complete
MKQTLSKQARLDDVARLAGVSSATVSRFFNNPDVVAAATAERIRTAVDQIGYVPNLLAGGLATNRSRLVAALVPHLTNSIFAETVEAMVGELSAEGYTVMLGVTGLIDQTLDAQIQNALARRADTIIITGIVTDDEVRNRLKRSNATIIETWGLPEYPIDVAIGFSHEDVGVEIARFINTRGYQRPHLLSARSKRAMIRRDSLCREWSKFSNNEPTETLLDIPVHFGRARGAFAEIRRLDPMPDIVVCGSDSLAQGIIVEAKSVGLRVPDDLAVIGFGNSMIAGEMRPTITSVEIDGARIARVTAEVMKKRATGQSQDENKIDIGFRIVARESA